MKKADLVLLGEIGRWSALAGCKPYKLAELLSISRSKWYRLRSNPGDMSLSELRAVLKVTKASDDAILRILKG